MVCVGRNYADHAAELGNDVPKEPLLFLKPSTSVIGPHDAIRLPPQSKQVEHEAELAVVIGGRPAPAGWTGPRPVPAIFGYTCANDVTARDLQRADVQFTRAKGFDSFCPLGPWIATGVDVADLEVRCEVNEEVRQLGRTKDMIFDVPTLVSYISHVMTLLPGDVILTGTPAGVSPIVARRHRHASRIDGHRRAEQPGRDAGVTQLPDTRFGEPYRRRVKFCLGAGSRANGVWGNWQPN